MKKLILIISLSLILVLVFGGGLWWRSGHKFNPKTLQQQPKKPAVAALSAPAVEVKLVPKTKGPFVKGKDFVIELVMSSSGSKKVMATDLRLSYNPAQLKLTKMASGEYFAKPIVPAQQNDVKKGHLLYSLASLTQDPKSSVLARFIFTPLQASSGKITLDNNTLVALTGGIKADLKIEDLTYTIKD